MDYNNLYSIISAADFECILTPTTDGGGGATERVAEHHPCGVGLKVTSSFEGYSTGVVTFDGANCVEQFLDELDRIYEQSMPILFAFMFP